jgi:hypothetical protein
VPGHFDKGLRVPVMGPRKGSTEGMKKGVQVIKLFLHKGVALVEEVL